MLDDRVTRQRKGAAASWDTVYESKGLPAQAELEHAFASARERADAEAHSSLTAETERGLPGFLRKNVPGLADRGADLVTRKVVGDIADLVRNSCDYSSYQRTLHAEALDLAFLESAKTDNADALEGLRKRVRSRVAGYVGCGDPDVKGVNAVVSAVLDFDAGDLQDIEDYKTLNRWLAQRTAGCVAQAPVESRRAQQRRTARGFEASRTKHMDDLLHKAQQTGKPEDRQKWQEAMSLVVYKTVRAKNPSRPEDWDDIAQDALLKLFEAMPRVEKSNYAFQVVRTVGIDRWRKRRRDVLVDDFEHRQADTRAPDDRVCARRKLHMIEELAYNGSAACRSRADVITLRATMQGLGPSEIAALFTVEGEDETTAHAVRERLRRIRRRLEQEVLRQ